jgi:hypothetical protein
VLYDRIGKLEKEMGVEPPSVLLKTTKEEFKNLTPYIPKNVNKQKKVKVLEIDPKPIFHKNKFPRT